MEKYQQYFEEGKKHFKTADHMAYVTFSILKENRLIIKIIQEICKSVVNVINAFLYYEYSYKRIKIYSSAEENLNTFLNKIALKYIKKQDLINIIRILDIEKKHKTSSIEFVRKDRFVILLDDKYEVLTIDCVKQMLNSARLFINSFPESMLSKP